MKKFYFSVLLLIITCVKAFAQVNDQVNLISNPGFEEHNYLDCGNPMQTPTAIDDLYGWYSKLCYSTQARLFCKLDTFLTPPLGYLDNLFTQQHVPYNNYGYQYPHSGNCYIYLNYGFVDSNHYILNPKKDQNATYIIDSLIQPLKIGHLYEFSFYVNAADVRGYPYIVNCQNIAAADGLGFSLKTYHPNGYVNDVPWMDNPSKAFVFDTLITDTSNWVLLKQKFVADSAYTYLELGYFQKDTYIKWASIKNANAGASLVHQSFHFIDDVSLIDLGEQNILSETGSTENNIIPTENSYLLGSVKHYSLPNKMIEPISANEIKVYYEANGKNLKLRFQGSFDYSNTMTLYSIDGKLEKLETIPSNPASEYNYSLENLSFGTYVCNLSNGKEQKSFKFIVTR
ncbi:MAG: hypothetical protein ORN56_02655 [Chitinophagales bacterium]|nr:hypothetical protein [Chitinophagales bacterium]